ncbi:MAG: hypothetical protein PVH62_05805, partial [Anaerolineae bacterium]
NGDIVGACLLSYRAAEEHPPGVGRRWPGGSSQPNRQLPQTCKRRLASSSVVTIGRRWGGFQSTLE